MTSWQRSEWHRSSPNLTDYYAISLNDREKKVRATLRISVLLSRIWTRDLNNQGATITQPQHSLLPVSLNNPKSQACNTTSAFVMASTHLLSFTLRLTCALFCWPDIPHPCTWQRTNAQLQTTNPPSENQTPQLFSYQPPPNATIQGLQEMLVLAAVRWFDKTSKKERSQHG